MNRIFSHAVLLGAVLWLVATLAIRLFGQWVFHPDTTSLFVAVIGGGLLMAVIGPFLRLRISAHSACADTVALGLILPGMLGDAGVALGFRHVYPNLSPALGGTFAALMLWYYAIAAIAITLHARLGRGTKAGAGDGPHGCDGSRTVVRPA